MSTRWNDDGTLDGQRFVCPNGCDVDFIVCGGPEEGYEGNRYFLVRPNGAYTDRLADGSRGATEDMHDHASGGCCSEPQCARCYEYADLVECAHA